MLGECKLDPTLINMLVERWRSETHICGECTITLEDVKLQLNLPVDWPIVTRSVVVSNWSGIYEQLLGKLSEKLLGGWTGMKWLQDNFQNLHGSSIPFLKEQHFRAYILRLIGGVLMPDKSQTLVNLRPELCGLPEELEDI
ncbi:hypothetical protein PVK06_023537 [Gossypium arboreum]|uniref:Aminotransferase-like plant mobile domain-containing protein n=1 Tax=Gossypium arboreum TaxID=29729 RepID=A0ABR0PBU8_GOSAR|nr:hypothetical protein PVK06_023537 [Gossypium arboreum]